MAESDRMLAVYLHLARASQMRRQPLVRDKLLILSGVRAHEMGLEQISALCRHKILAHNARHLVGQWPTLTAALADAEFQTYLKQLGRRFSPEKSEHILDSLGIEMGRERDVYASELEYAAALLDTRPEMIADILAQDPIRTPQSAADSPDESRACTSGTALQVAPWMRNFKPLVAWVAILSGLLAVACLILWLALSR